MREPFVHEAVLTMAADADTAAPGAAITVALCGHWEHEPPCPLSPHRSRAERVGGDVHIRTIFEAEPASEDVVRGRIDGALNCGQLRGLDGTTVRWTLRSSGPGIVLGDEADDARRLALG